jgi:hypothetical protein
MQHIFEKFKFLEISETAPKCMLVYVNLEYCLFPVVLQSSDSATVNC